MKFNEHELSSIKFSFTASPTNNFICCAIQHFRQYFCLHIRLPEWIIRKYGTKNTKSFSLKTTQHDTRLDSINIHVKLRNESQFFLNFFFSSSVQCCALSLTSLSSLLKLLQVSRVWIILSNDNNTNVFNQK